MAVDADAMVIDHGGHAVHFYERDVDLIATAGRYLTRAALVGEVAVIIATGAHRRAFEAEIAGAGVDVTRARSTGRLVSLDAASLLSRIVVAGQIDDGKIDASRFDSEVGDVMRGLAGSGRRVRAYGEMVSLLWDAGNVLAAIELEALWNDLGRDVAFSLLCAYPTHCVSGPAHAEAFDQVCDLHSVVIGRHSAAGPSSPPAWPGAFGEAIRLPAELSSARAARRFVVDAMRRQCQPDDMVDDAALVVTELATNAIVHARSAFTVTISSDATAVRIAVHDADPALPTERVAAATAQSGRGLALVNALASRWGTDVTDGGKRVWVELRT